MRQTPTCRGHWSQSATQKTLWQKHNSQTSSRPPSSHPTCCQVGGNRGFDAPKNIFSKGLTSPNHVWKVKFATHEGIAGSRVEHRNRATAQPRNRATAQPRNRAIAGIPFCPAQLPRSIAAGQFFPSPSQFPPPLSHRASSGYAPAASLSDSQPSRSHSQGSRNHGAASLSHCQDSLSHFVAPISRCQDSRSRCGAPINRCQGSLGHCGAPISRSQAPTDHCTAPISHRQGSLSRCAAPLSHCETPISRCEAPENGWKRPFSHQNGLQSRYSPTNGHFATHWHLSCLACPRSPFLSSH